MARRIIQFPVRNAFAHQRSHDSLALDTETHAQRTEEHTQRIAQQVDGEMVRKAERLASGRATAFEKARTFGVLAMPSPRQPSALRKLRNSILGLFRQHPE